MKLQHVIYLSGGSVALYTWDRQAYVPVAGYELPDGDPARLLTYLRETNAAVVSIVVDVLEEEHNRDTMANLGRRDRDAMLTRKLARVFPRTSYRTAAVQDRLPGDSQSIRVLLSGLTKAEHLQALLSLLAAAKVPVASVCSPALLSRPLLDKLRPASPADATLIVSRQQEGSLRLSYFRGKYLVGSRLMRRSLAAPPGDLERLVRQLEESVRYFDAAFTPSAGNPIDVVLLCEPGIDPAAATARGTDHEGFRLIVPNPAEAARKLGLNGSLQAGNADLLFVELLRRHAPAGNFAVAADRRYFHLHQVRIFGKAACLALAGGALLGSVLNVVSIFGTAQATASTRAAIGDIQGQLDPSTTGELANAADPLEMQRVANAWQAIQRHSVEPGAVLGLVSTAVDNNPDVQIEAIEWLPLQAVATTTSGEDTGAEDMPAAPDEAPAEAPASSDDQKQRVRLTIRGRIQPFDGDYPRAFLSMRSFMQALRIDPRVLSVNAVREPLDLSPRSTLTGELTAERKTEKAGFTLNVLLRFNDETA